MKQESIQNNDWNNTGSAESTAIAFSRSNSSVPEYPLPCDSEILSCDDDYPQVVARMPKLNTGWFQESSARTTVQSLSRIFKTQRLGVFGLIAVFISAGLFGTMFYYSGADNQQGASAVPADQASLEGSSSQESLDGSIPGGQTPVGSGLFASPVISSENEKSVLATIPSENPLPSPWIQSGVATSAVPDAPAISTPESIPTIPADATASLPVSVPQTPIQASSPMPSAAPSQPVNPGWGDLSANAVETGPVTQYSAGRPAENTSETGIYSGGNQTMNTVSPDQADIRLVSGQNNSMPNDAYSTRIIDENGRNIAGTPVMSSPMGNPADPAVQSYDPNSGMAAHPYPQNQPAQTGQEPVRVAVNPYASNQTFSPQSSIPAYTPNQMTSGATERPVTVPTESVPGDVIATPMGQYTPTGSQSAASAVPFVAGENGFRGYSVDTSKQVTPTDYSSNPYLEKTDRIR